MRLVRLSVKPFDKQCFGSGNRDIVHARQLITRLWLQYGE